MKIVSLAVFSVILPKPVENGCFDKFPLPPPPPPPACSLFTISVKNQARLITMKIVDPYSRVFTVTGFGSCEPNLDLALILCLTDPTLTSPRGVQNHFSHFKKVSLRLNHYFAKIIKD